MGLSDNKGEQASIMIFHLSGIFHSRQARLFISVRRAMEKSPLGYYADTNVGGGGS